MITITGYLHRERLKDIIRRWMYGDLRPADATEITRLIHYNNVFVSRYLGIFSEKILRALHSKPLELRRARLKGDLKEVIVSDLPCRNARIDEMVGNFHANPELYYKETPFYGTLYFICQGEGKCYVGSSRIKRVRRLAEKSARRIIDWLFASIIKRAYDLAEERARSIGISHERLITPKEKMIKEFLKAESRLLDDLKNRRMIHVADNLAIHDVAGLKVIVEDEDHDRVFSLLSDMVDCEVVEKEVHAGDYNATNLIVRFRPHREEIIAEPLGGSLLRLMESRGVSPAKVSEDFREFLETGEEGVELEIILSNYQEMLESEIGRCIHEERIIRQRQEQQYTGQLARNVEYLMEYLFSFPASHQVGIDDLPIKLWYRYLPDYIDEVWKRLFSVSSSEVLE
jgi:hypothetical protein